MKGEYIKPNNETTPQTPNTMFSKLHPHFSATLQECKTPEEETNSPKKPCNDGATIEVIRRPRGRPPGSKNKPKPPVIITREATQPAMTPHILEIQTGKDITEAVSLFCQRNNTGLCVLSGSGIVANVTLKQPSTTPGATVTFHGRFDILSISATFLAPAFACPMQGGFSISLAGPQGQVVGGLVAGSLLAAGTVHLVAASFNNPSFHRLHAGCEDAKQNCGEGAGDVQSPHVSGGDQQGDEPMFGSDVIWGPAARQTQATPPY